jgi:hypothetical protein
MESPPLDGTRPISLGDSMLLSQSTSSSFHTSSDSHSASPPPRSGGLAATPKRSDPPSERSLVGRAERAPHRGQKRPLTCIVTVEVRGVEAPDLSRAAVAGEAYVASSNQSETRPAARSHGGGQEAEGPSGRPGVWPRPPGWPHRPPGCYPPGDLARPPAQQPDGGGEVPLGRSEGRASTGHQHGLRRDHSRLSEIAGQRGEGAPRHGEPEVGVERAPEELEVVGQEDERPEGHEGEQPPRHHRGPQDSQPDGGRERGDRQRPQELARYQGAERAAVQLVQGMGAHPHPEEERQEGGGQVSPVEDRLRGRSHGHVRQVPRGVGRMKQRPVVTPPPGRSA